MGSYQRFPKAGAGSAGAMRRDREWREADLRRRSVRRPRPAASPAERIDTSREFRLRTEPCGLADLNLFAQAAQPTRH